MIGKSASRQSDQNCSANWMRRLHDAVMQGKTEKALIVGCTTCGARPREKCELNCGLPRTTPHPARSLAAEKKARSAAIRPRQLE
jgi:hypothetical protein